MKQTVFLIAMLALLMAVGSTPAFAVITLDFSTGLGTGGTITYAGGAAPLVGINIGIGTITSVNTPSNAGEADVVTGGCAASKNGFGVTSSGCLSFTTGNFVSSSNGVDTFGPGGSITILGSTVACLTVGGCAAGANTTSGNPLLSGQIVSATFTTTGNIQLTLATGTDIKDPGMLAYFGLAANTPFQFGPGSIHTAYTTVGGVLQSPGNCAAGNGCFSATSTNSTDIPNTVVPEPTSILFFGTVLVGTVQLARRKFAKR